MSRDNFALVFAALVYTISSTFYARYNYSEEYRVSLSVLYSLDEFLLRRSETSSTFHNKIEENALKPE